MRKQIGYFDTLGSTISLQIYRKRKTSGDTIEIFQYLRKIVTEKKRSTYSPKNLKAGQEVKMEAYQREV